MTSSPSTGGNYHYTSTSTSGSLSPVLQLGPGRAARHAGVGRSVGGAPQSRRVRRRGQHRQVPLVEGRRHVCTFFKFSYYTGCPILLCPLSFCHFLGFWSTYRGPFDHFSTALEICYMIATRIFKFDSDIAEIIEVKVGTSITPKLFFDSAIAKFQFLNDGCQL